MARFKGRTTVACHLCHQQKLKCSGDIPCQRCHRRGLQCTFPSKDRIVAVPESYLRHLEREAALARSSITAAETVQPAGTRSGQTQQPPEPDSRARPMHDAAVDGSGRQDQPGDRLLEGSSAEQFVQKLRELSLAASSPRDINGRSTGSGLPNLLPPISLSSNYTYLRLKFDVFKPEVSFRLPPLPYAIQLLGFFEEGFCDYHWMLRRRFRERLLQMYADPRSQAHDQAWLCCVSIIMALGETYSYGRLLDTAKGNQTGDATEDLPPGAELFEQGLLLLRNPLEEARVEDVVALNLAAFYCYSLNRRKTAYLMAGQSVRVALLLRLHEPWPKTPNSTLKVGSGDSGINSDRIEAEHRKRVWWTSYCMDNMVSTEFGFSSGQDAHAHGDGDGASTIPLPSNEGLCDSDREEFYDGQVLAAQIGLCRIKALVIENVTRQIRSDSNAESSDAVFAAIIRYMDMLRRWQSSLPADMVFSLDNGVPAELMSSPKRRVLLSLYLRYYQCTILLIRPLLLQELYKTAKHESRSNLSNEEIKEATAQENSPSSSAQLVSLKMKCIRAAQCNCRILNCLWIDGKIAKFGYWDALHLFSCLAILCLARVLNLPETTAAPMNPECSPNVPEFPPSSPESHQEREMLYHQARALLVDMALVGNPAAKDYVVMLGDVEDMVGKVLARREATEEDAEPSMSTTIRFQSLQGEAGGKGCNGDEAGILDFSTSLDAGMTPFLDMGNAVETDTAATTANLFQDMFHGNFWQAMDWDGLFNSTFPSE